MTIITREGKGSPLTRAELDGNFTELGEFAYRTPLSADFPTTIVGGSATFTKTDFTGKGLGVRLLGNATNAAGAIVQAAPSTPFTMTARIVAQAETSAAQLLAGLVLRNSSNGRCLILYINSDDSIQFQRWTTIDTYFTNIHSLSIPQVRNFGGARYLSVHVTAGGAITVFYSSNGAYWIQVGGSAEASASYITQAGGSLDQIGLYLGIDKAAGRIAHMLCPYFRLDTTTPPNVALI